MRSSSVSIGSAGNPAVSSRPSPSSLLFLLRFNPVFFLACLLANCSTYRDVHSDPLLSHCSHYQNDQHLFHIDVSRSAATACYSNPDGKWGPAEARTYDLMCGFPLTSDLSRSTRITSDILLPDHLALVLDVGAGRSHRSGNRDRSESSRVGRC